MTQDSAEGPSEDTKRIFPSWNYNPRRGIAFEVAHDSKLDSNRSALDVLRIFEEHWDLRPNLWPRTVEFRTKKGQTRTMTDLGPWYECDRCKHRIVEYEGNPPRCTSSGVLICEYCEPQQVQDAKLAKARDKKAALDAKEMKKHRHNVTPLLPE